MTTVTASAQPSPAPRRTLPGRRSGARIRCIAVWALLLPGPGIALAAGDDETARARWDALRATLFADHPVQDGAALLQLETPYRAEDAAVVPIRVRSLLDPAAGRTIRNLYLIIDMNPVPLAATIHFPPTRAWQELATRIRVNAYGNVRAVAETDDGQLYTVANFVKASGGCSAPATKDPATAAAQRGRMKLVLPEHFGPGEPITAQLMIRHPNHSGMQFDQVARDYIPADYVKHITVEYQGQSILDADTNISLSEDPSLRFDLVPAGGELRVLVEDSTGHAFTREFPVAPTP